MTNRTQLTARHWLLAGAAMAALATSAPAAFAQDGEDETLDDRVLVTGSRVARDNFTAENPLTIVTGDSLVRSGLTDVGQALRQQLAVTSGGFGQSQVTSGGGSSSIDLRNLGQDRVLVLINGRRVANFADSLANEAADLSFIPTTFVERIEILRDGASTTYGADAVSGVINIILKEDFQGVNLSGSFGAATEELDNETTTLSATLGGNFDDGRGNIVANVEYRRREPVRQLDRADWAVPAIVALGNGFAFHGSSFTPGGLFLGDNGAVVCADFDAFGGFTGDGTTDLFATTGSCPAAGLAGFSSTASEPSEVDIINYDYSFQQNIINGQELFTAATFGTYDFTSWLTGFMEMEYAKRESNVRLDGNPGSLGTPAFPNGWRVPDTNPNNFTGENGTFRIRPTNTFGVRQSIIDSNMIRAVVGLQGQDLLGLFDWELSYLWTKVDSFIQTQNVWNLERAIRISDPDACAQDIICSAAVNPSGALDVFFPGNWTPSEIGYINADNNQSSFFETQNVQGYISGDIFQLPAGPLGVAAGFEYRDEQGQVEPDSVVVSGASVSNQTFPTAGSFDVWEAFAEVNIPVLKDLPFARELSVNVQGRWFDYSNFGSDTVYKFTSVYAPTEDVRFRASYGRSFRAPTIVDLFGGGTVSADNFTDPCTNYGQLDATDPTNANIIANCAADGLAANFVQPSPQYNVLRGGNPNLTPEEGTSWTIGAVFSPRWIEGLQASIDWYEIKVENAIAGLVSDAVVDTCYEGPAGLAAPECAQFGRSPATGAVVGLTNPLQNLGYIETNGVEFNIAYARDIEAFGILDGTFGIDIGGSYLHDFDNNGSGQAGDAADSDLRGNSLPRWRSRAEVTWLQGPWTGLYRVRHIGDTDDPAFDGNNLFDYEGAPNHVEHDVYVEYVYNTYTIGAGVNNLLNKEPPYVFGIGANTDINLYSTAAIGRFAFVRVSADF